MKEIYQAFRSAGVAEMESIKVTDSFNNIINRIEKESIRRDKEILVNRILLGMIVALTLGILINSVS